MNIWQALRLIATLLAALGAWEFFYKVFNCETILSKSSIVLLIPSIILASCLGWVASWRIKKWISRPNEQENGRDSDCNCLVSACLAGFVGIVLVITEVVQDVPIVYFKFKDGGGFVLEELLLGFGGICMLLEEFRLLRSDSEARRSADKLLKEMKGKTKEVDRSHKEIEEKISKVGPVITQAVTNIFK